jgi:hypothetical protein
LFCNILNSFAPVTSKIALDTLGSIAPIADADLVDNLSNVMAASFGIIRVWPGLNGFMSKIAITNSS